MEKRDSFPCQMCGDEFPTRQELEKHRKQDHPETDQIPVKCPVCGAEFANQARLDLHRQQHHTRV